MHEARLDGSAFFPERIQNLWDDVPDKAGECVFIFGPSTIGYEVSFEALYNTQIS